ncbi:MAG: hypothetical protein ACLTZT_00140 [Butyricimonas faecalis]
MSYQDVNALSRNEYKCVVNYFTRWVVMNGLDFWQLKDRIYPGINRTC